MKIGTWNIEGIPRKQTELVSEMERLDIDIIGLSETMNKDQGEEKTEHSY